MKSHEARKDGANESSKQSPRPAASGPALSAAPPSYGIAFIDEMLTEAPKISAQPGPLLQRQAAASASPPNGASSLPIEPPDDPLEKEAEYIAEQVTSGSGDLGAASGPRSGLGFRLQRMCACGGAGGCETCKKRSLLQKMPSRANASGEAPSVVHDVLKSPGRSLPPAVRSFFEPRFGHDFSNVRIHDDSMAAKSADAVGARAYTVARSLVFSSGSFAPETVEGRKLIAHELAHVVQQSSERSTTNSLGRPPAKEPLRSSPVSLRRQRIESGQPDNDTLDTITASLIDTMWGEPDDDVSVLITELRTLVKNYQAPPGPLTQAAAARALIASVNKLRADEREAARDGDGALLRANRWAFGDEERNLPWTPSRPHTVADLKKDIPGFDPENEQDWILTAETSPLPRSAVPSGQKPIRSGPKGPVSPAAPAPPAASASIDKVIFEPPDFSGALVVTLPGNVYAKVAGERYAQTDNRARALAWAKYLFASNASVIVANESPHGGLIYYVAEIEPSLNQSDLRAKPLASNPKFLGAEGRVLSSLPGGYSVILVRLADGTIWAASRQSLTTFEEQVALAQKQGTAELTGNAITAAGLTVDWRMKEIRRLFDLRWVGDDEEKQLIQIISQTPSEQAADLLKRLSAEKINDHNLLEELDDRIDGENNQTLHEVLSTLRLMTRPAATSVDDLTQAPVLPWHDVMGFFEDSATFSVEKTDQGKYRIHYFGTQIMNSKDFGSEIHALPFNIFVGGMDYDPDQIVIIHDYDNGRFVPLSVQELAGYQHAGIRNFLAHVGTVASFAIPVSEAVSVGGRIAVYTFERVLPALFLLVDENRLNILEWFPKWGSRILKYVDIAKVGVAVYGAAQFAVSGAKFFQAWKRVRGMRQALDGVAVSGEAEKIARALESESDRVITQAEAIQKAESGGKLSQTAEHLDPNLEANSGTSVADEAKAGGATGTGVKSEASTTPPSGSKFNVMEGVKKDTEDFLNAESNKPLRDALEANPKAAKLLKRCNSLCYPGFAKPGQIRRIEGILARAENRGFNINTKRLQEVLRDPNITTAEQFGNVVDQVDKALEQQERISGYISEAVGAKRARMIEPTPSKALQQTLDDRFDRIAQYRQTEGLPSTSRAGESGTVATTEIGGTNYFGTSSHLAGHDALSLELRQRWFTQLKGEGKLAGLENLGQAQFLSHAEAGSLINAYDQIGRAGMPKRVEIFVDRTLCPNCRNFLEDLAGSMGVEELNVYYLNQTVTPHPVYSR